MSTKTNYNAVASILRADDLPVTAAEMHGLLSGMLCGGMSSTSHEWMPILYDYTNDGLDWPAESKSFASQQFKQIHHDLTNNALTFRLLLPSDDEKLHEQASALSEWVNAFIAGIGLVGITSDQLSEESNEILRDLSEIALIDTDEEEEDLPEQLALFEQVLEHVRVCAMVLHANLTTEHIVSPSNPKLH